MPAKSIVPRVVRLDLCYRLRTVRDVPRIIGHAGHGLGIADRLERQAGGINNSRGCGSGAGTQHGEHRDRAQYVLQPHWPSPLA